MIEIGYIVRATLACNPAVNHDRVQADTVGAVPFLISIGRGAMLLNEALGQ